MRGRWLKVLSVAYAAALVVVSVLPSSGPGQGGWDTALSPKTQNILHVPAYTVLMIVTAAAWDASRSRPWRLVAVALGAIALGAALEGVQAMVPGRMGSLSDALLNAAGVGLGAVMLLGRRTCLVCNLVTRGLGCPPVAEETNKKP